jgi:hypothetical protein
MLMALSLFILFLHTENVFIYKINRYSICFTFIRYYSEKLNNEIQINNIMCQIPENLIFIFKFIFYLFMYTVLIRKTVHTVIRNFL